MRQVTRPLIIAITGGIASGKSTVSRWFIDHGYTVHNADKIGHNLLLDEAIISKLSEKFGSVILTNNKIDREKLGKSIFANPTRLEFLNNLMHPAIRKKMLDIIETSSQKYLFFEIPLLFEGNLQDSFDLVINVHTTLQNQISRLVHRDSFSKEEANQRISSQLSSSERVILAEINVDNNHHLSNLYLQLEKILAKLPKCPHKDVIPIFRDHII